MAMSSVVALSNSTYLTFLSTSTLVITVVMELQGILHVMKMTAFNCHYKNLSCIGVKYLTTEICT